MERKQQRMFYGVAAVVVMGLLVVQGVRCSENPYDCKEKCKEKGETCSKNSDFVICCVQAQETQDPEKVESYCQQLCSTLCENVSPPPPTPSPVGKESGGGGMSALVISLVVIICVVLFVLFFLIVLNKSETFQNIMASISGGRFPTETINDATDNVFMAVMMVLEPLAHIALDVVEGLYAQITSLRAGREDSSAGDDDNYSLLNEESEDVAFSEGRFPDAKTTTTADDENDSDNMEEGDPLAGMDEDYDGDLGIEMTTTTDELGEEESGNALVTMDF
mmetsp:Transcript_27787/g.77705  ORF Transcript_27787/g.77705 Transcript_27787/m.77705 type:complete len:278 (+) Transcript_27787:114-947(+)